MEFLYSVAVDMFPARKVPDWISKHPAIMDRDIKKVFPSFGLSNFKEKINLPVSEIGHGVNTDFVIKALYDIAKQVKQANIVVDIEISTFYRNEIHKLDSKIEREINRQLLEVEPLSQEYKALSNKAWDPEKYLEPRVKHLKEYGKELSDLLTNFFMSINPSKDLDNNAISDCIRQQPDGTVKFILTDTIILGNKNIGIPGENLPRVYGKIKSLVDKFLADIGSASRLMPLDQITAVKNFNSENIPVNKDGMHIVFSATGKDGAWDLATMSMRGISSCQKWNSEFGEDGKTNLNSCLIGSIASNYVGIIYLTSGSDYKDLGAKMVKRCVVRFGIDMSKPKKERKPVIILDKMYSQHSPAIAQAFINALQSKTSLQVIDFSNEQTSNNALQIALPYEEIPRVFSPSPTNDNLEEPYGLTSYQDTDFPTNNKKVRQRDGTHKELDG